MARFGRRFPIPAKHVWTNTVAAPAPVAKRLMMVTLLNRRPVIGRSKRQVRTWANTIGGPCRAFVFRSAILASRIIRGKQ